jgi:hypothetical protein
LFLDGSFSGGLFCFFTFFIELFLLDAAFLFLLSDESETFSLCCLLLDSESFGFSFLLGF